MPSTSAPSPVITRSALLKHWQGHRRLTRKVIEAFPEGELFRFSIGGMRPFSEMARELMGLAGSGIHGIARGDWPKPSGAMDHRNPDAAPGSKQEIVDLWDGVTADLDEIWPQIPADRFQQWDSAWGLYEGPVWSHIFYFIDNEVHHRGQGYVYLRALDVEPPFFWDRA